MLSDSHAPAASDSCRDPVLVELCAGGIDDVQLAAELAVDRIELNCGMPLGGLTPSLGLLQQARTVFPGPIIAMVRPREGGFCYSPAEFSQLLTDAQLLLDHGASGLACGFLHADGTVDEARCEQFRRQFSDCTLVFHRAFDVLPDLLHGLQQLAHCGWNRILTSGGQATALGGASVLQRLHALSRGRIEILAGGGIRAEHVQPLVNATGIRQLHAAVRSLQSDSSTHCAPHLQFGWPQTDNNGAFGSASRSLLTELLQAARAKPPVTTAAAPAVASAATTIPTSSPPCGSRPNFPDCDHVTQELSQ